MPELGDPQRLAALERTQLLDSPAERAFDRLTALAGRELGVPITLVSLVTPDRQFFKSQCGLPAPLDVERETPLSHSFCKHVVQTEEPLVVVDAARDPRVADNLAIGELGVAAYAGYPLTLDGEILGTFCALDTTPREWSARDLELLREMAGVATDIVELRTALLDASPGRELQ